MAAFVDRVTVHVAAGNGGHGVSSVHREKYKPLGGPDGGNGGDGGDIVLEVDPSVHTLLDFHHRPHQKAGNGKPGEGSNRHGARGEDKVLRVPAGTVVSTPDGRVIADLVGAGTRVVARRRAARAASATPRSPTPRRKAPGFALLGEHGEAFDAVIELKSIADVGLVGFPSAGKSSLIAAMSAARPKIADYPFTTLVPNLGVIRSGDTVYTMADVPGLIPGASTGKGLGVQFLRHVERCAVLVHVVDMATMEPGPRPGERHRGARARAGRVRRRRARPGRPAADRRPQQDRRARTPASSSTWCAPRWRSAASTSTRSARRPARGCAEFGYALAARRRGSTARACRRWSRPASPIAPKAVDDTGFTVERDPDDPDGFVVHGVRPERWVRQTDFTNDEAVGFLADRLNRLGVEEAAGQGRRASRATRSPSAGSPSTGCRRCRPARSPSRSPPASAAAAPTAASTRRTGCAPRSGWPPRRRAGCRTSSASRDLDRRRPPGRRAVTES